MIIDLVLKLRLVVLTSPIDSASEESTDDYLLHNLHVPVFVERDCALQRINPQN